MTAQTCNTCALEKDLSEFQTNKNCANGRQRRCKACMAVALKARKLADPERFARQRKAYYAKNREKVLAINAASRAKHADKVKAHKKVAFQKQKTDPVWQEAQRLKRRANAAQKKAYDEAYAIANRERVTARALAWSKRNPSKRSAISKAYSARRRAIEAGGDSTKAIHAWEQAQKKVCYWCGVSCAKDYHVDHYEPLSTGGKHEIRNLVIACPPCNLRKNAKDPYKFAQQHAGRLF